jgi:hypothetical protein
MSNLGGFTDAQAFEVLGSAAAFVAAYLADRYTTMVGLANKMVEGNPLMRWLIAKMGFSLSAFAVGGAILVGGIALTNVGIAQTCAFYGIIAAGEAVVAVRNYLKLKSAKISLR